MHGGATACLLFCFRMIITKADPYGSNYHFHERRAAWLNMKEACAIMISGEDASL